MYRKQKDIILVICVTILVGIWLFVIDNLDKDESAYTREQCFTNTFKIMSIVVIVKITNSEIVCKWHDLFRIQEQFPLLKKEKYQIPYFL